MTQNQNINIVKKHELNAQSQNTPTKKCSHAVTATLGPGNTAIHEMSGTADLMELLSSKKREKNEINK